MAGQTSAPDPQPLLDQRLRAFQFNGHRRGAAVSALASLAGGLLAVLLLRQQLQPVAGALWLLSLVGVQLWRHWLLADGARAGAAAGRLGLLRLSSALHGGCWACLLLLPPWPWPPAVVDPLLAGLGVAVLAGTAMCLMYDPIAALGFAAPPLLALALGLQAHAGPGSRSLLLVGGLALAVGLILALTARALRRGVRELASDLARDAEQGRRSAAGEALLRRVFDHIGDGLCMFDADARLVAWNARMVDLAGLEPGQAQVGTPLRAVLESMAARGDFGDVEPVAEVERRLAKLRGREPTWGRLRRPGGRVVEVRSNPMPDGGFTLLAVDLTERRASARALAENRAMLALLLRNTEEGVWTIDNELRTLDANAAMCRMLGVTHEQIVGRSIYDFVDAENEAIFRDQVRRRDLGLPGSYEITLRRADGTPVHTQNNPTPLLDARGRKVGAIGLFSDITPIRRAAAELASTSRQLEAQTRVLEATLDSLDQGVLAVDRQGLVESFNQRAVDLLQTPPGLLRHGLPLREVVAWQLQAGYFDHLGSEPVVRARAEVQRYVEGDDAAASSGHYWRERPDGVIIEVKVHPSAGGGEVRTYADVTERVQAERALIAARDDAERANRAKSEFLSRMSHELRTPLNAVIGFAQLLEREDATLTDAMRRDHVHQILQGGHHLLGLINEVLDLARIESGALPVQIGSVEVGPLVEGCRRLLQPMAAERGVHLHLRPPPQPGRVAADPRRLQQVMLNLLSNAIKYNRAGGDVVLSYVPLPERLRIEVGDSGPGLSAEQQERLFQAFERLDADVSAVEGAGIGLALSKALVDLMQGTIGVRSRVGEGSTFWVELPLSTAPAEPVVAPAPAPVARLPEPPAGRHWRVLYIEDNAVNQIVVQSMLARLPGLDLALADDPVAGLAMLQAQPPDLLLLDIQLPTMDGYEVLRRVRSDPATAALPVVAVSANAMASDLRHAREAGFDHYLTKPLDLPELVAVISGILARA